MIQNKSIYYGIYTYVLLDTSTFRDHTVTKQKQIIHNRHLFRISWKAITHEIATVSTWRHRWKLTIIGAGIFSMDQSFTLTWWNEFVFCFFPKKKRNETKNNNKYIYVVRFEQMMVIEAYIQQKKRQPNPWGSQNPFAFFRENQNICFKHANVGFFSARPQKKQCLMPRGRNNRNPMHMDTCNGYIIALIQIGKYYIMGLHLHIVRNWIWREQTKISKKIRSISMHLNVFVLFCFLLLFDWLFQSSISDFILNNNKAEEDINLHGKTKQVQNACK